MYTQVASRLVTTGTSEYFSQAVSMAGGNAVQIESTNFASGTCDIFLQVSNDLENWADASGSASIGAAATSYDSAQVTAISAAYVRLRYKNKTASCVLAAGINVANL